MWEGGRDSPVVPLREHRGLKSHQEHQHSLGGAGRKPAMWVREPQRAEGPSWCWVAAPQRPFLLWGCSVSTAWFLQGKQRALTAPSGNGRSLPAHHLNFGKKGRVGLCS